MTSKIRPTQNTLREPIRRADVLDLGLQAKQAHWNVKWNSRTNLPALLSVRGARFPGATLKSSKLHVNQPVAQTFLSAGSRDIPVPCFWLAANWRLESRQNPQTRMSALQRRAIGAAPLPLFRAHRQPRIQRVQRRVSAAAMRVLVVANQRVKRLRLPKLFARPMQELVPLTRWASQDAQLVGVRSLDSGFSSAPLPRLLSTPFPSRLVSQTNLPLN